MKRLMLFGVMLALAATPAFAQWGSDAPGFVGLGIGLSGPNSNGLDARADSSYSISGYASRPLRGPIGWRAEASYDAFSQSDDFKDGCEIAGLDCSKPSATRLAGGLQVGGFGEGSTLPYFALTGGFYNVNFGLGDSETDLGLALVTGVNWAVSDTWGVGIDFHYNGFWPDEVAGEKPDAQWYTVTAIQLYRRW